MTLLFCLQMFTCLTKKINTRKFTFHTVSFVFKNVKLREKYLKIYLLYCIYPSVM